MNLFMTILAHAADAPLREGPRWILEIAFIIFTFVVVGQVLYIGIQFYIERKDELTRLHYIHVFLNSLGSAILCLYVAIDQLVSINHYWYLTLLGLIGVILLNIGLVKLYAKGHLSQSPWHG